MNQKNEKILRVKYMRLLEKFAKSSLNTLRLENFQYALFENRIRKIYSKIENLGEIKANSSYMNSLKNFISFTMKTLERDDLKEYEKQELLLKEANLLEKQKNRRGQKSLKHKGKDFFSEY